MKWDSLDPLEMYRVIRVSANNDVFVAGSKNGIIVIRGSEIIYSKTEEESIENLFITSDGEFVFLNLNNRLCVRKFLELSANVFDLKHVIYEEMHRIEDGAVVDVTFDQFELRAIVTHQNGVLNLYDISQRTSNIITFLDTFSTNVLLMTSKISFDLKWIVISDYQIGFRYFRWMDDNDDQSSEQTQKIKNKLNIYLIGTSLSIMETNFYITKDSRYVITLDYYSGISTYDLKPLQDIHGSNVKPDTFEMLDLAPVLSKWWPTAKGQTSSMALAVSADEKFAAMGMRSVAIYIVDIRDILNPKLYQKIKETSMSYSVAFSQDSNEEYLFYSNGISVKRFKKQIPNLNIDVPNLYNVHRSMFKSMNSNYLQYGSPDKQGQFYFLTAEEKGLFILDLRKSVVLMDDCVHFEAEELSFIDNFVLFGGIEQRYLAIPRINTTANTMMDILDISDRTQPVLIVQIQLERNSYSGSMDFHEDRSLFIFDNENQIVLASTTNLPNSVEIKSIFNYETGSFKAISFLTISTDGNFVLLLSRTNGMYVINIEDLENPINMGFEVFLGSESLVKGKYKYSSYMFLADGLSGIKVIDQTAFPLIKIIKVIEIRGFAMGMALFKEDKYALASSVDVGQISLIDLTDITTATVVSTFEFSDEDAESVSILYNEDYFYIVNYKGVRVAPLFSDTFIHMDIQEVLNSQTGTPTLLSLSKDTIFQVGQIIDLTFIILRPVNKISITGIFYLQYYDVVDIPYWMTYNNKEQLLQLKIVKDSLGSDYSSNEAKVQKNTIIIETKRPVLVTDFVFYLDKNGVDCSIDQAYMIWEYLKNAGLLNKHSQVTSLFEYEDEFEFEINGVESSEKLFQLVKMALQESIMYNPIIFTVQASLSMNVTPTIDKQSNYLLFIETISEYVYLYLTINQSLGKFVSKSYAGVITSTSDTFDQIKLEGDPVNINKVLTSRVYLYLYNSTDAEMNEVTISVRLTDNINYEVEQSHSIYDVEFLKFLPSIAQNPEMRLQDQVERKYSGQSVDVKTNIDLQFVTNSFLAESGSQLIYSAKIINKGKDGDQFVEIEKNFWFQFTASSFKFSGTSTFSDYNQQICFQINATDSYSWMTDDFCLNPSRIPLIVILNLIIQYIGPVLFIIGLYKYKDRIYNMTYSRRNVYMKQELRVGEYFEMPTIFVGQQMVIAHEIFNQLLIHNEIYSEKLTLDLIICNAIKILFQIIRSSFENCIGRQYQSDIKSHILSLIKQKNEPNQITKKLSEKYLDYSKDNSILVDKFFIDLMNLNISNEMIRSIEADFQTIQQDLFNEYSILRLCLLNQLSRNLLEQDELSNYIYSLAKQYNFKKTNSKVDRFYYHKFTIVNHQIPVETNNLSYEKFKQSFQTQPSISSVSLTDKLPRVTFKDTILNEFFQYFENEFKQLLGDQQASKKHSAIFSCDSEVVNCNQENEHITIKRRGKNLINQQLIKQVILLDALGLDLKQASMLTPCAGESLNLNIHQIASVQSFQKPKQKQQFSKLRSWLNMEYLPIASHENRKIPEWLNLSFKRNLLLLEGRPGVGEEGNEYLIRFYDRRYFIVKQFIIKVINDSKLQEPSRDKQENNRLLISSAEHDMLSQKKGVKNRTNYFYQNQQYTNQSFIDFTPDESPSKNQMSFPVSSIPPLFN